MAGGMNDPYNRVAPPKGIKDVPRFLSELLKGFFFRLFYTFRMVWDTGHWILFAMIAVAVLFIGLFIGIAWIIAVQMKYNRGIF